MHNLYSPLTIPYTLSEWILKATTSQNHNAPLLIVVEELTPPATLIEAVEDRFDSALKDGFLDEFWHGTLAQYWSVRPRAASVLVYQRGDDGKWHANRTELRP